MRITYCDMKNFGSYENFKINFSNCGLSLIYGNTGAGKSTIMDMVCWGLFGVTAKDGKADDVRSWGSEEATRGEIWIGNDHILDLMIVRTRGKGKNDLVLYENGNNVEIRGKDLVETQKLLNSKLGLDLETFMAGSYFHEFSPTGAFFTAKAKDRRELFEKLAPLELPNRLQTRSSDFRKAAKTKLAEKEKLLAGATARFEQTLENLNNAISSFESWEIDRAKKVVKLEKAAENFELSKGAKISALNNKSYQFEINRSVGIMAAGQRIQDLEPKIKPAAYFVQLGKYLDASESRKCATCGAPEAHADLDGKKKALFQATFDNNQNINDLRRHQENLAELTSKKNQYEDEIERVKAEKDYSSALLQEEKNRTNPWGPEQEKLAILLADLEAKEKTIKAEVKDLEARIQGFTTILTICGSLRAELLRNCIESVQNTTNKYLETYFDSELRVRFELDGADDLDVGIHKSGYDCSYKQLSKGQRGLIKLCFSLATMQAVSDASGVQFENIFLDESLDGLDANLKVKAFSLFQSLAENRSSVMVIDHASELQNMFENKFHVTMEGDRSQFNA